MNYNIVGYGSLLSHNSLSKTIPDRSFTPVVVKGYKRVFNLKAERDRDPDVLNLKPDGRAQFNGVLFSVNEDELVKIKEREDDYNLEETNCYDFTTGKPLGRCFITIDHVVGIDDAARPPDKSYFILCREAAYAVSEAFGKAWDETTYVASGERVSEWLRKNPSYGSATKMPA